MSANPAIRDHFKMKTHSMPIAQVARHFDNHVKGMKNTFLRPLTMS